MSLMFKLSVCSELLLYSSRKKIIFTPIRMELFKPFRKLVPILIGHKLLEEYGFPTLSVFKKSLYRFTNLFGYIVLASGFILSCGFIALEAKTFQEFSDFFYGFVTLLNDTFYFLYMPWFCRNALELNKSYVDLIDKREFKFSFCSILFKINWSMYLISLFFLIARNPGSVHPAKAATYIKSCEFVELTSKFIYVGYVKIVFPFVTIPYLLMSYFKYYTSDLKKDAFRLPFDTWCDYHLISFLYSDLMICLVLLFKVYVWLETTKHVHLCIYFWILYKRLFNNHSCHFIDTRNRIMLAVFDIYWWREDRIMRPKWVQEEARYSSKTSRPSGEFHWAAFNDKTVECFSFNCAMKGKANYKSINCLAFFRMLLNFGSTYKLIFTSDLLWTLSTMTVSLLSIQIELVVLFIHHIVIYNFFFKIMFIFISDEIRAKHTSNFEIVYSDNDIDNSIAGCLQCLGNVTHSLGWH